MHVPTLLKIIYEGPKRPQLKATFELCALKEVLPSKISVELCSCRHLKDSRSTSSEVEFTNCNSSNISSFEEIVNEDILEQINATVLEQNIFFRKTQS
jgi:hypothetical protein